MTSLFLRVPEGTLKANAGLADYATYEAEPTHTVWSVSRTSFWKEGA